MGQRRRGMRAWGYQRGQTWRQGPATRPLFSSPDHAVCSWCTNVTVHDMVRCTCGCDTCLRVHWCTVSKPSC